MLTRLSGAGAYAHVRCNVVGYVALFALLTTGTAQAVDGPLPGTNTVGSEDIIANEVRSADIANGGIFNVEIADDLIQSGKIKDGTLAGADVALNALGTVDVIESTLFNDNSLITTDIDESTLFNDNSLTAGDLSTDSVGASEIAIGAIDSDEVVDNSLTAGDLGSGSVGASEIAADSVRASELGFLGLAGASEVVEPNTEEIVTAACPAGQIAIGGTATITDDRSGTSDTLRTLASFPVKATGAAPLDGEPFTGWRAIFFNGQLSPSQTEIGRVSATCLAGP